MPSGGPTEPLTPPARLRRAGGIPADCPTSAPAPLAADDGDRHLATDEGDIVVEAVPFAPNATGSLALAECGAYDSVVFTASSRVRHRGGDVSTEDADGSRARRDRRPGYTITDDP
jgi:hypothetical protein